MAANGRDRRLKRWAALGRFTALVACAVLPALAPRSRASAMKPGLPYRAKECAFIWDGGQFHVFYIRDDMEMAFDSTERDFGHATSYDLVHWTQYPPILATRPDGWDNFHVWSPTIVHQDSTWYLFYAGVTYVPGEINRLQRIGLATSPDLFEWTRVDAPIQGGADVAWVYCDSLIADGGDFRDPFVMPDPASPGGWLMYVCTRPDAARDEMVLGLSGSSGDLSSWSDRGPMWNLDPTHTFSPLIESPALIEHDGLWYLFYDTNSSHTINYQTSLDPAADSTGWSPQRHLSSEITTEGTDAWFGPELLRVGGHDYFCAVNSDSYGLEFREIVWGAPGHFRFIEPSTQGLAAPPGNAPRDLTLQVRHEASRWRFEIGSPDARHVRLDVVDVGGRRIAVIADRDVPAGATEIGWDGVGQGARRLASGIYFARLSSPRGVRVARFAIVR